jgi:predicted permease
MPGRARESVMVLGVLAAIVPVFVIIAAGYVAVRSGYVDPDQLGALASFVLRVALPALIFGALTGAPLGDTLNWGYLAAYGLGTLGVFGLGFFAARRWSRLGVTAATVQALGMASANSGFMGFPIASMVIGPPAAAILAQNMVVENLLLIPFGMMLAEVGQRSHGSVAEMLRNIVASLVRNPLLVAIAAGVAVAALGVRLPEPLARPVALMGAVAGPVALFVVGGTLAGLPSGGAPDGIGRIVFGKLVLHPLVVFGLLFVMPGIDPGLLAGGAIFAAAPMMSIYPIIGARFGEARLAAASLFVATVLSAVSISVLILLLGRAGLVSLG